MCVWSVVLRLRKRNMVCHLSAYKFCLKRSVESHIGCCFRIHDEFQSKNRTPGKHVRVMYTSLTPVFFHGKLDYSGVDLLIFDQKHTLFQRVPTMYVLSQNIKKK